MKANAISVALGVQRAVMLKMPDMALRATNVASNAVMRGRSLASHSLETGSPRHRHHCQQSLRTPPLTRGHPLVSLSASHQPWQTARASAFALQSCMTGLASAWADSRHCRHALELDLRGSHPDLHHTVGRREHGTPEAEAHYACCSMVCRRPCASSACMTMGQLTR